MIAVPAIDLRGGRCVQLVGGRPEEERVSLPDPVRVAERWWDLGFRSLHLVDLDAALGEGENREILEALLAATPADTQVGGGIRDDEGAEALLAAGADRVVVGTRAIRDPEGFAALARRHPGRVMAAADVKAGTVLVRGWREASPLSILDFLARMAELPLGGILCTDVAREGRMEGIDPDQARQVVEGTRHPVWISGGIHTLEILRSLAGAGAAGAVLGMALYTDVLDARSVAEEFGT